MFFQAPKPNRPQGNSGLLHSHMQLCCRNWRIIFWMTNPQFSEPGFPENTKYIELNGANHYFGPQQSCSGRWPLSRVKGFVESHVCTPTGSWCCRAQPVHFCHQLWNPANKMTGGLPLPSDPCTQTSMCPHSASYILEVVHLCYARWFFVRDWRYNVVNGRCSKHDDILSIDGGTTVH